MLHSGSSGLCYETICFKKLNKRIFFFFNFEGEKGKNNNHNSFFIPALDVLDQKVNYLTQKKVALGGI